MIGNKELQFIQHHIVLQEIVELANKDIINMRESRMPLKGLAIQNAKTTLACFLMDMRESREQLRENRIWVANQGVSQGEDVLVFRYAHQGKPGVYPITRRGLREMAERQSELIVEKWTRIWDERFRV